jgi:hypothetical protein
MKRPRHSDRAGCGIERLWRHAAGRFHPDTPRRILVLGDSHVRVFEHPWFAFALPQVRFDIEYVPGATAIGIVNRHSTTSALIRFTEVLAASRHDWILVNLGEVDTAYSLWKLVDFRGVALEVLLDEATQNYCAFIADVSARHRLAVLSAPLPTLADQAAPQDDTAQMRRQVNATRRERTELANAFNARIGAFCRANDVPFLDSSRDALGPDGLVKRSWCRWRGFDHHYERWPYARCLTRQLKSLCRAEQTRGVNRRPLATRPDTKHGELL